MIQEKDIVIVEQCDLSQFEYGVEIRDLGLAHRTKDCHFEVIDPQQGRVRSLMTGEDVDVKVGYYVLLDNVASLPLTSDLQDAEKGQYYCHLLGGCCYKVLAADDPHLVRLLDLSNSQVRLHSRLGSEYFYIYQVGGEELPPIDDDGQFLLFEM